VVRRETTNSRVATASAARRMSSHGKLDSELVSDGSPLFWIVTDGRPLDVEVPERAAFGLLRCAEAGGGVSL
jgi:hypothetical protein